MKILFISTMSVAAVILISTIAFIFNTQTKINKFTAMCDARGGLVLKNYCIKKDVVIMEMK